MSKIYDCLVIGAGPTGIGCALKLHEKNFDVVCRRHLFVRCRVGRGDCGKLRIKGGGTKVRADGHACQRMGSR